MDDRFVKSAALTTYDAGPTAEPCTMLAEMGSIADVTPLYLLYLYLLYLTIDILMGRRDVILSPVFYSDSNLKLFSSDLTVKTSSKI